MNYRMVIGFALMLTTALQSKVSHLFTLESECADICAKVVDPTNTKLAVAYKNGKIQIWDIESGECEKDTIVENFKIETDCSDCSLCTKIKKSLPIEAIAWHKEESCLYIRLYWKEKDIHSVVKYDVNSGTFSSVAIDSDFQYIYPFFSMDSRREFALDGPSVAKICSHLCLPLFKADYDYINKFWVGCICIENRCVKQITENIFYRGLSAWNPTGDLLFLEHKNSLEVRDWKNDKVVYTFDHPGRIVNIKCAPNNKYVAVEYEDLNNSYSSNDVMLWDLVLGKKIAIADEIYMQVPNLALYGAKNPTFDVTGNKMFTENQNGIDVWSIS